MTFDGASLFSHRPRPLHIDDQDGCFGVADASANYREDTAELFFKTAAIDALTIDE